MTNPHITLLSYSVGSFRELTPYEKLIQQLRDDPNSYAGMMMQMAGALPEV